jgi:integrase
MPRRSNSRITDKSVRRKPTDKPIEIRDCDVRGFILRIEPTGTKTFYAEWARGQRTRIGDANITTLELARDTAIQKIAEGKRGEIPEPQIRSRIPTLKRFVDERYHDWAVANQKSGEANCKRINSAFSGLINNRIDKITPWQIDKFKAERKKDGTNPATINRDIKGLKAALNKAVEWELIKSNPIRSVKPLKGADNRRVRYLNTDEEKDLLAALEARDAKKRVERISANRWRSERRHDLLPLIRKGEFADHIRPMVLVSMNTGLRFGELTSLTWKDVSLINQPQVTVQAGYSKSGKIRHIPLNKTAVNVLRTWHRQLQPHSGLVFPSGSGKRLTTVKTAWTKLRNDAGLKDFKWHDLRHHFASRLVMAGVDLNTVRELLGHGSLDMTIRYAHLAPEHKAEAVERIVNYEN